jgi:hypothetical protein
VGRGAEPSARKTFCRSSWSCYSTFFKGPLDTNKDSGGSRPPAQPWHTPFLHVDEHNIVPPPPPSRPSPSQRQGHVRRGFCRDIAGLVATDPESFLCSSANLRVYAGTSFRSFNWPSTGLQLALPIFLPRTPPMARLSNGILASSSRVFFVHGKYARSR